MWEFWTQSSYTYACMFFTDPTRQVAPRRCKVKAKQFWG
jgi:hypothetical protein